ncbi:hypothetical protein WUBG_08272 [Wuchereria bancrofti]|uniref:Uncharacterized protein n=1 Tax=Wuchereria bancrofti TaxID=6293 RepID=J9B1N5_WUCBA|nr:hypothetical protein WUBG_08272 [Wuchereria bancrofti]
MCDDNQITANVHAHDFSESLTKGLHDSTGVHLIHATEPVFFYILLEPFLLVIQWVTNMILFEMTAGNRLSFVDLQMLSRSPEVEGADGDLDALIRKAQHEPVTTAMADPSLDASLSDSVPVTRTTVQPR